MLCAIAFAGCVAAAYAFSLALTSEAVRGELGEPLVIAFLGNWITVTYVLGGILAWSRRPASSFGPLMIAAGFVNFLVTLSWTTKDVTFTVGQALDLVPPVLFLHVFLAYPTGRLVGRLERVLIAVAYATAIGAPARSAGVRGLRARQPARAGSESAGGPRSGARPAPRGERVLPGRPRDSRRSAASRGSALRRSLAYSSIPSRSAQR